MKSDMPDSDVDYDKIKSSERRYVVLNGAENPYNIKSAINEFQRYSVTDVAIEYLKNISDKECENKEAEITTWWFSFERNKMLFEIKMQIITGKGDKDKYIRDTYATYLKDVQQYVQEQNCFEEEAFDYVKKPYVKKDDDKALKQKMMDVQDAIEDLCYCPIGSTPFVPGNARYVQKSYWQKFQNLTISADLKEIPDIVFQRMPDSVTHLNLAFNRLKTISSYISRLKQLKSLYLDYNENLENDGIPWESLPISIETFSCDNTGLKTISQNIQRLVNLKDLKLTNCNIQVILLKMSLN
uniref:Leucine-rich repeat domain-containing protein n=1 Tax=Panagrolaimus davidi TaxID=227884 RepID=A0A914Q2P7_9BILA